VLRSAAAPSAGDEAATGEVATFADHTFWGSAADPAVLLGVLQEVDWSAFVAERDLLPLRAHLLHPEREHGVTEVHRFVTDRIRGLGGTRLHFGASFACGHVETVGSSTVVMSRSDHDDLR
jgi:hypothetical protein